MPVRIFDGGIILGERERECVQKRAMEGVVWWEQRLGAVKSPACQCQSPDLALTATARLNQQIDRNGLGANMGGVMQGGQGAWDSPQLASRRVYVWLQSNEQARASGAHPSQKGVGMQKPNRQSALAHAARAHHPKFEVAGAHATRGLLSISEAGGACLVVVAALRVLTVSCQTPEPLM
jgi:hypothetical protein